MCITHVEHNKTWCNGLNAGGRFSFCVYCYLICATGCIGTSAILVFNFRSCKHWKPWLWTMKHFTFVLVAWCADSYTCRLCHFSWSRICSKAVSLDACSLFCFKIWIQRNWLQNLKRWYIFALILTMKSSINFELKLIFSRNFSLQKQFK